MTWHLTMATTLHCVRTLRSIRGPRLLPTTFSLIQQTSRTSITSSSLNHTLPNKPHSQSITSSSHNMSKAFLDAVRTRRSYYPMKKESPIPDSRIQEIINEVVLHVPGSFNAQSTRVVLLLHAEHEKLWDITREVLQAIVPAEQFGSTDQKLQMFKGAYATVSSRLSLSLHDN